MARRIWLLLVLLVVPACTPDESPEPTESGAQDPTILTRVLMVADDRTRAEAQEAVAPSRLAGWYYTAMLGYSLDLDLRADGSFDLEWGGCLGVCGTATGTWYLDPDGLALVPARAAGLLAEQPVRHLFLARLGGHYLLVQESDRDRFVQDGPSGSTCLAPEAVAGARKRRPVR